ncbi:transposable element tc3 transposase-like protein, partial [Leptotrombidium deliense]
MRGNNFSNIFFQQDGAPAHTAKVTKEFLCGTFGNNLIGKGLNIAWPPRSPDLTPPDFFLWGYLKNRVYKRSPRSLDELSRAINLETRRIPQKMLENVAAGVLRRAHLCKLTKGDHFQHLLKKRKQSAK